MANAKLAELLREGDKQKCVEFFRGLSERERRALAPECLKWHNSLKRQRFIESPPGTFSMNPLLPAAEIARFATATLSEMGRSIRDVLPEAKTAFEMLDDRRPDWIDELVARLLDTEYYWHHWSLVRRLVCAGLARRPVHPHYYLGMIGGLASWFGREEFTIERALLNDLELLKHEVWGLFEHEGGGENSLANYDRFSRGPNWADTLRSLMTQGKLDRRRLYAATMAALARDFNAYRAKWFLDFHDSLEPTAQERSANAEQYVRLLGATAPNVVSWAFQQVSELAREGVVEGPALAAACQPVLRAKHKGLPLEALRILREIATQHPGKRVLVAETALAGLGHEHKDVQCAALDLLEWCREALAPEFVARVAEHEPLVAASLRKRLAPWRVGDSQAAAATDKSKGAAAKGARKSGATGRGAAPTAPGKASSSVDSWRQLPADERKWLALDVLERNAKEGLFEIPSATFDGTEFDRLGGVERLAPIGDLDELIDVCAAALEDETRVDDAERVFDGLSRLCGERPDDFERRTGALLKRVRQLLKNKRFPFGGLGPSDDVCGVAYAWCSGILLKPRTKAGSERMISMAFEGHTLEWFAGNLRKPLGTLTRRSLALASRVVERRPAPLLSAPTHAGGWIEPAALVERSAADSGPHDPSDMVLALLRLAPDGRAAALAALGPAPRGADEWSRALRHALGAKGIRVGESAPLWAAAARARAPWEDDSAVLKAFPELGPDTGQAASRTWRVKKSRNLLRLEIDTQPSPPKKFVEDLPTVALVASSGGGRDLSFELGGFAGRTVGAVRWTATIWPLARESYFAAAAQEISDNLDWWEAQWQDKALFEPLLDPGTPLRPMALLLMGLGLAAKEPGEHGLAIDCALRAIEDGRLGGANLGATLYELLRGESIKPGRWQKTLAEVARGSSAHAAVVHQALQRTLVGDLAKLPRDTNKLLELLLELSAELGIGVDHVPLRESLESLGKSGKVGKTGTALLALPPASLERVHELLNEAATLRAAARRGG